MIRLKIRMEDFSESVVPDVASEDEPTPPALQKLDKKIKDVRNKIAQEKGASPPNGGGAPNVNPALTKELRKLQAEKKQLKDQAPKPRAQTETPGDVFSIDLSIVPLEVNVELNSPLLADKAEVSFAFRDCPLMSELIRSALLEVFLGTVPSEVFAQPDRWPLSLDRQKIMFRGYVDTWDTNHDGEDATVQISARSLEAVLIDTKINPSSDTFKIAKKGERISAYVNRILQGVPATSGKFGGDPLRAILFRTPLSKEPVIDQKLLNRNQQTAKSQNQAAGATAGQMPPAEGEPVAPDATNPADIPGTGQPRMPAQVPQGMSAWDLIVQACRMVNLVPMYDPAIDPNLTPAPTGVPLEAGFEGPEEQRPVFGETLPIDAEGPRAPKAGDALLLRPPSSIYEGQSGDDLLPGGSVDGFERQVRFGDDAAKKKRQIRFLVWGRNIKSIKTSRKLGRIKAPAIEVISTNTDADPKKRSVRVRYPKNNRRTRVGSKGEGGSNEVVAVNVGEGIRDLEQLTKTAASIYQSMCRQETSVAIETDDISSYQDPTDPENNNMNPDVLGLRAGMAVRVIVARLTRDPANPQVSPLSEVFGRRASETAKFIQRQAGRFSPSADPFAEGDRMADAIAAAIERRKLTDLFFVRSIKHKFTFEDDGGWSADMELVNFIEARSLPDTISKEAQQISDSMKLFKRGREPRLNRQLQVESRTNVVTPSP